MKEETKKPLWKRSSLWMTVGMVVVAVIVYNIGHTLATTNLEEEKANYDEIISEIDKKNDKLDGVTDKLDDKQKELDNLVTKIEDKQKELDDKGDEVDTALKAVDNKDEIEDNISNLKDNLSDKNSELDDLKENIESKEEQLEKIKTNIVEAEDDPIELLSGEWVVGIDADVPEGRYQASGSSNFTVRDNNGSLKVNTILGASGDGDYVFFAEEGDFIEAASKTTLTPVEE